MKLVLSKDNSSEIYTLEHNNVIVKIRKYSFTDGNNTLVCGYVSNIYNRKNSKSYSSFFNINKTLPIIEIIKLTSKVLANKSFLNQPVFLELK